MTALPRGGNSQARSLMRHRARIVTPAEAPDDEYGSPAYDTTPDVLHEALPCYAWSPKDAREVIDGDVSATFGAVRISMPLGSGVTERNVITAIVDRAGRVVFHGPLYITAVTPMADALGVMARLTRGGG